jgi:hypothetical protein
MKNATKGKILKWLAIGIDVGVPLAATLSQFPLWVDRSTASTISGLSLVLIAFACIPFYRQIREYFKSPSAPVLWTVLFLLFTVLENISSEIKVICFFGAIANYIGSCIYKIGAEIGEREDNKEEEA